MAIEMKEAAVEIAPLNPTPEKATEAVRTKRARSPPLMESEASEEAPADYEKYREERIRANMERMQKLGLLGLSRDVKSAFSAPKRQVVLPSYGLKKKVDLTPPPPPRRSLRLNPPLPPTPRRSPRLKKAGDTSFTQKSTRNCRSEEFYTKTRSEKIPQREKPQQVVYTETDSMESHNLAEPDSILIQEGTREEIYTEEHEKLLGSCEAPWTLFVDGYNKDGTCIYDQVNGKTCHQCRLNIVGYRTSCTKCQHVQGQFCGDCLYMRYGENVLETIQNPNWICPACRHICNCGFCRIKKGWNPTGPLYEKVLNLGYKSVAHYLIQTYRKPANSGEAPSSASEAAMSNNTEVAREDQPKPEIIPEKSDQSMIVVSSDENSTEAAMSVNTEVAKEDEPKPETIPEKSGESMVVVISSDEDSAIQQL